MHVVATAGHVDHGKSTLIRLLTGIEPDRWAEERRRGMTIDLGYAWTRLPSGAQVAFVDVPGHERFISNMLAGVGPVPAVLLVVAADEGWREQTEEHVAALAGLGVRHLLVAVTRSDLRDPAVACDEAVRRLDQHGLAPIDVVRVSGRTGDGLDELRGALDRLVSALPAPDVDHPTRLWVDRVFTIRGAGVVATGTLQTGRLAVGDTVEVAPAGETFVVRGLESCKERIERVDATARVAVNLRGARADTIRRGDAIVAPGAWRPVTTVDARLSHPLASGTMTLHLGSASVTARVRALGAAATTSARITLTTALPLRVGDRGLLRHPGAHAAGVGAQVLDVDPLPLRRRGDAARRASALDDVARPTVADLVAWHEAMPVADVRAVLPSAPLPSQDDADVVVHEPWLVATATWQQWREQLPAAIDSGDPLSRGRSRGDLVRLLGLPDPRLLEPLLAEAGAAVHAGWVRPAAATQRWSDAVESALCEVEALLRKDPFRAPDVHELDALGIDERVRGVAADAGRLLRISPTIYLLPESIEAAAARLAELPQPFSVADARECLDSTRRTVVPLLEYLDSAGYTRRDRAGGRMVHR